MIKMIMSLQWVDLSQLNVMFQVWGMYSCLADWNGSWFIPVAFWDTFP